jgi:hypothetical protein
VKLPLFDKVSLSMDGSIGGLFLLVKGYFDKDILTPTFFSA